MISTFLTVSTSFAFVLTLNISGFTSPQTTSRSAVNFRPFDTLPPTSGKPHFRLTTTAFSFLAAAFASHNRPIRLEFNLEFPPRVQLAASDDSTGEERALKVAFADVFTSYLLETHRFFSGEHHLRLIHAELFPRRVTALFQLVERLSESYFKLELAGARMSYC